MGQVNCIFIVLKRALPCQSIVVSSVLPFHRVLIVAYIRPCPDPPSSSFLSSGVRVHQRPHTVIVERVGLDQVDDVESVVLTCFSVGYTEVIPLCVTSCVVIRLQDKIILVLIDLNCSSEISTLESRLKHECIVIRTLRDVERNYFPLWGFTLLIWRRVYRIVNNSVH